MRMAVIFTTSVLVAGVLVAGCSQAPAGQPRPTQLTPITPSRGQSTPPASPSSASPATTAASDAPDAPAPGAPITAATGWVQAAGPADAADYNVALRGGTSTDLGADIAFTTTSGISCMTDAKRGPGLACLVDLADPPPQPPDIYGAWKGGWVDFDGTRVAVGSAHADPGRFAAGQGAPLPPDRSLSFGDFRCRADATALVCVNFAHQTAVRYSDAGINPVGCTRESPPGAGIGIEFRC
jgi:hypothetical protein